MVAQALLLSVFFFATSWAQSVTATDIAATSITTTRSDISANVPTGSYQSYSTQITIATSALYSSLTASASISANSSYIASNRTNTTSSSSLLLVGTSHQTILNGTATATATSTVALPVNTQPCNNYPEFCTRKWSNITEVCSHNSAFIRKNSAFANQAVPIIGQLNDGIRMIQGETHYYNNTMYSCHSNCSFLNAGTYESELTIVREWLDANPFDVVTLLIVNSDYVNVENFTDPVVKSGIIDYVYLPPKRPMTLDDWPTLSEMILSGKRVVMFMDYQANQTSVPYILDEFSQMWETPFSPTDPAFPCTAQRPPSITDQQAMNRPYVANHNLNVDLSLAGLDILIPNFANLTSVNAFSGNWSLGKMARECRSMWDRPPNFLLVDFYEVGNGSVFEVAAQMNGVTYNRDCCGLRTAISGARGVRGPDMWLAFAVALIFGFWSLA